ncbi:MAG TPA: hypothetical protein VG891_00770 [Rhizomicrobium sp.]|nr:hypothetical protein [Rhizomicrobium sp.]
MVDISSHPELVRHYMKLADELDETADQIRRRPGMDYDLSLKLQNIADEIRQNIGLMPSGLRPKGMTN